MKLGLDDVIASHIKSTLRNIYTGMPAKVVKVSQSGTGTVVDVLPLTNKYAPNDSAYEFDVIPEIPVLMPAGGGSLVSLPVAVDDTVMLMFSMNSLDEFLASDGKNPQTPFSKRSHSLSDAVALTGLFTSVNSPVIDPETLQLRNGIGETESNIDVRKDGKVIINGASSVELGEGAGEALVLGDSFKTLYDAHTHPTGVGPSGPPQVAMTELSTYTKTK